MCQNTRSRSAASDPRISATRSPAQRLAGVRRRGRGPQPHQRVTDQPLLLAPVRARGAQRRQPDVERRGRLVVPHEGEPPAHPIRLQDQQRHIRVRAEVGDQAVQHDAVAAAGVRRISGDCPSTPDEYRTDAIPLRHHYTLADLTRIRCRDAFSVGQTIVVRDIIFGEPFTEWP
jgi:hypothetical protein